MQWRHYFGKRKLASTTVEIAAPIELVWATMLDVGAYGEWNPFILRIDGIAGPPAVGQVMRLLVRFSSGMTTRSTEVISRLEPPASVAGVQRATLAYSFRGPLHTLHLVRASRFQYLTQPADGLTIYHTEEEFRGFFRRLVPLQGVQDGFERHARALKTRAESLAKRTSKG
jgi:hypothetical protein